MNTVLNRIMNKAKLHSFCKISIISSSFTTSITCKMSFDTFSKNKNRTLAQRIIMLMKIQLQTCRLFERILLAVKINEVDSANKAFEDLMGGETDARKK